MAVVTLLNAARMLAIEAASVVGGSVNGSGHLILTKHDGSTIDAGNVLGPAASIQGGGGTPANPVVGQIFFDKSNLESLTDLMAAKNPATSTANWLAYGYGYDTAITFTVAGGGVTCTWGGTTGNHFAGIPLTGLTQGESYLILAKVRVPTGSPNVMLTAGYKTSGHIMSIKNQDVTMLLAFTADDTAASFGIETVPGATSGSCIVKELKVYAANQRGFPEYIFDGSGWIETAHMAQKADIYSRVNTFGSQLIKGVKQFYDQLWAGSMPSGNPFIHASGNAEAGALPVLAVSQDNSAGGFTGMVIRGVVGSAAVGRSAGILLKMSTEADANESNKAWEIAAYSAQTWANQPGLIFRNAGTAVNALTIDGATDKVAIAKDASVGQLLTVDQSKIIRTIDISGTNLNSLTEGGFYNGSSLTNAPHGDTGWWYIEQMVHSNLGSNYAVQRATQLTAADPAVFQRTKIAGTWNAWKWQSGGLPSTVYTDIANQAITQLTSFAGLPTAASAAIASSFPWECIATLEAWLSVTNGASSDIRVGYALSGANVAGAAAGGWQAALYAANTPALTGAPVNYNSHSVSTYHSPMAAGTTTFTVQSYKTGSAATSINYGRLIVRPIKLRDG